jgi:hypothetical protein
MMEPIKQKCRVCGTDILTTNEVQDPICAFCSIEPRKEHDDIRMKALIGAIYRYNEAGQLVEPVWLEEALELARKFWKEDGRE